MLIGVDVGGSKIEAMAMTESGRELQRVRVAMPRGDYIATLDTIARLVSRIEKENGCTAAVGVGIPGTVVAATGLVKNSNATWLIGQPFQRDISELLGREVRCANDANCFAASEATDGVAANYSVVFGAILGTGCGGGIAINGNVHTGSNGLAGEWGHTPLPWAREEELIAPDCYCGRRGCIESWISGTGFERDYHSATGRAIAAADIASAAERGEPAAIAAFQRLEDRMARSFALIINILDPDAIVLGGGLSRIDRIYMGVASRIGEYCFGGSADTPILRAMYGDSSGVRGAAWLWNGTHPAGRERSRKGAAMETERTPLTIASVPGNSGE